MPVRTTKATPRAAFLRGINVGGARILKMDELRRLAVRVGFRGVRTIGASGNVLYSSAGTPENDARRLTKLLEERFESCTVVVREASAMRTLVRTSPFIEPDPVVPDKWRFVALLERASRLALPELPVPSPIRFAGRSAREVFYTMREPTGQALAMAGRLERALGTSLTVRNWNVVRAITKELVAPARTPAARQP